MTPGDAPSKRQTGRNIVAIWANRLLAILAPLIVTPIVTHHFGLELIGVWLMATQIASHLMLFDAGLANSLVRLLAGQHAVLDTRKGSSYLATAFYVLLGFGLLLLLAAPFLAAGFVWSLHLTTENTPGVDMLALLAVIYVAVSLPLRVGHGLLAGVHRFDSIQLWDSFAIAIRLGLVLAVFRWWQPSLVDLGLIVFGSGLFSVAAVFVQGLRLNPLLSLRPSSVSRTALGDLSSMGGAALLATVASVLLMQSSSLLTGYTIGPDAVALVAFPLMIYTSLTPFLMTLPLIVTPIAAGISSKGEVEKLLPMFIMTARYQASAALLLFLGVIVLGDTLITGWLSGPKLGPVELQTVTAGIVILFAGFAVSSIAQMGRSILNSVGWHWSVAVIELMTAIGGLALGYLLTQYPQLGVLGVAVGITTTLIVRGLFCYPVMLARFFATSPVMLLIKVLGLPASIVGVTALVGWAIGGRLGGVVVGHDIVALIGVWVVPVLCWIVFTWYLVVPAGHREILLVYLGRRKEATS